MPETEPTPPAIPSEDVTVLSFDRKTGDLYVTLSKGQENGSFLSIIQKAEDQDLAAQSKQAVTTGLKDLPFDMRALRKLGSFSPHHARCLQAKAAAITGLGFSPETEMTPTAAPTSPASPGPDGTPPQPGVQMGPGSQSKPANRREQAKAEEILDPLCILGSDSFQDVLNAVTEDYVETNNGYFEVVRDDSGKAIRGIYHMPTYAPRINVENENFDLHYRVNTGDGTRLFARFGDLDGFRSRNAQVLGAQTKVSELIHLRRPSSHSRWYGWPNWLSAVPAIELAKALHQHEQDFFLNRGVPEFMLFLIGKKLAKPAWSKIEDALRAQIGSGNSHKSLAINIEAMPDEIKIELHKLMQEGQGEARAFGDRVETLGLEVVTAHGVPPLLAGIQISGKLGATNELPNAIMAFQLLYAGQEQKKITSTLTRTFGDKERNGGLALGPGDFVLRAITDELNLGAMDTMSRMRETAPEAAAGGRDLNAGVKD